MKDKQKFFCSPPDVEMQFCELFRKIWDTGIGREVDEYGQPQAWTALAFEEAYSLRNVRISQRAIEYWRSGTSVPSPKNMRTLAALIAEEEMFESWLNAIQSSVKLQKRKDEQPVETAQQDVSIDDEIGEMSASVGHSKLSILTLSIAAVSAMGLIVISIQNALTQRQPTVVDLKICSPANFSSTNQRCRTNEDHFPEGTKKIFLSFGFKNLKRGEEFTRKWFIDGQLYLEKSSHFIEPWEGWTWLGNPDPNAAGAVDMDTGKYTLQIHAGDTIEVRSFFVGQP